MLSRLGNTFLHHASEAGDIISLKKCLAWNYNIDATNFFGETPLHLACQKGYLEIVKQLLQYKADVNAFDRQGLTPLHHACIYNHVHVVKELIKWGADINLDGGCGHGSALDIAIDKSREDIINALQQRPSSAHESTPFLNQAKIRQNDRDTHQECCVIL